MDENDMNVFSKTQRSAKQGRRAKNNEPIPDADADEEPGTMDVANSETIEAPPKPSKRVSGWGEDSGRRKRRERLRPRPTTMDDDDDDDNDIPVIPDLEEQQDDDIATQVAMAPTVAVNRVATYRELDNDLLQHASFLTLDNEIDLKLLSKGLCAEADVQEDDKPWDWDLLFTEVTSELLREWERKEQAEEEKAVS